MRSSSQARGWGARVRRVCACAADVSTRWPARCLSCRRRPAVTLALSLPERGPGPCAEARSALPMAMPGRTAWLHAQRGARPWRPAHHARAGARRRGGGRRAGARGACSRLRGPAGRGARGQAGAGCRLPAPRARARRGRGPGARRAVSHDHRRPALRSRPCMALANCSACGCAPGPAMASQVCVSRGTPASACIYSHA